jgi:hypothetical protein
MIGIMMMIAAVAGALEAVVLVVAASAAVAVSPAAVEVLVEAGRQAHGKTRTLTFIRRR